MYSDDNQIYKSSNLNNFQDLVDNVEKSIDHVNKWMIANKLKKQHRQDRGYSLFNTQIEIIVHSNIIVGDASIAFSKQGPRSSY